MFGVLLTVRDSFCLDNWAHQMNKNNQSENPCVSVCACVFVWIYMTSYPQVFTIIKEKRMKIERFL